MSAEKIIGDWKKKNFKPVYWLEGEEPYFIDKVMNYAEHNILSETEANFNLTIFYGRDADAVTVVNVCRQYPMIGEKQVVLIKEAQHMRDILKLESYVENPMASTVLVISYKDKKVDARTKFAKALKEYGEIFSTKKLYDNQLPEWVNQLLQQKGLSITQKALLLLVDHIGNDLSRLENEIDKLIVSVAGRKQITEQDIETYVGVSKEFNVFELQDAVAKKNLPKAIRIVQYFEANPKAASIQALLPSLYSFFSKVAMIFGAGSNDEKMIASTISVHPYFVKDYLAAAKIYNYTGTEKVLLLLHQYNLRSIGIHDTGTEDGSLMKELLVKMLN
ncbi:MAG: DNA polymerase III subunit delta [Chitinophagaceae bacterium]|jgi:DNA polymerase-3 subunit delta|nr:DNA polymerase III subunit delta [Chitinophagaceae bacterium]